ncbi:hypothetical protein ACSSS7_002709 [Eimeria intestinalis]
MCLFVCRAIQEAPCKEGGFLYPEEKSTQSSPASHQNRGYLVATWTFIRGSRPAAGEAPAQGRRPGHQQQQQQQAAAAAANPAAAAAAPSKPLLYGFSPLHPSWLAS